MKVLHVITGLSTGGAERALYNLLTGGLAADFDCQVISLADEGVYGEPIRALGVPVHALNMRRGAPSPADIPRLRQVVRAFRPRLVQGWMYHGNLAASLSGRLAQDRPAVVWNVRHSLYDLAEEKPMTRQIIRANRLLSGRTDAVLYNSRLSREQHEAFGFADRGGRVIPNGFDVDLLWPDPEKGRSMRQALGVPLGARVVGHVARFHPMKDHARFLRAAARVAGEYPDVRFLLVGRKVEPGNPDLAGLVPPEFERRFLFLGERDDVPDLMQAMDVLCQSSAWGEAFPNVLGEAMASGVPCVATDVGDSAGILGDTGMIVPPRDDEALLGGLQAMLSKSGEERRMRGQAARARVENNYALPAIVEEYAALYESLVSSSAGQFDQAEQ